MKSSGYTRASNDSNRFGVQPSNRDMNSAGSNAAAATDDLRDSIYGHSHHDRDNTHSGYGGHNTSNDNYGRDKSMHNTSAGMRQSADMPMQNTSEGKRENIGFASDVHGPDAPNSGNTQHLRSSGTGRSGFSSDVYGHDASDSGTTQHLQSSGSKISSTANSGATQNAHNLGFGQTADSEIAHHPHPQNTGGGNVSASGKQSLSGTGTSHHQHDSGIGQFDPSIPVASTRVNSGMGIHAQQYTGRDNPSVVDSYRHDGGGHHDGGHHGYAGEGSENRSTSTGAMKDHHTNYIPNHNASGGAGNENGSRLAPNQPMGHGSQSMDTGGRNVGMGDASYGSHIGANQPMSRASQSTDTSGLGGGSRSQGMWTKTMGVNRDKADEPPHKLNFDNSPKDKPTMSEKIIGGANKLVDKVVKS